jgi:hypothetical protein
MGLIELVRYLLPSFRNYQNLMRAGKEEPKRCSPLLLVTLTLARLNPVIPTPSSQLESSHRPLSWVVFA